MVSKKLLSFAVLLAMAPAGEVLASTTDVAPAAPVADADNVARFGASDRQCRLLSGFFLAHGIGLS